MRELLRSLLKNTRRWLPGVLISAIALAVVFRVATWQDLRASFALIKPINVLAAFLITLVSLSTRALAWRVLLENRASFLQSFLVINEGYLLNNLFPLRAGELGRAIFMGQATGLGSFHVLSTIVIERAFDLAMAATLILLTLPLALGMDWVKPVAFITLALVVLGLVALYLAARYSDKVNNWLTKAAERWVFARSKIIPRLGSLLNGLKVLTKPDRFLLSLMWIMFSWVLWVLTYYIMILNIAPQAPLWWAAFVDGVLALGVAIPSAPAALGVFEAAMVGSLSLL
jgi:hypothetical protein